MAIVVITGAHGVIARAVVPLLDAAHDLRFIDVVAPEDPADWPGAWFVAPISDRRMLDAALEGANAVVHLAGVSTEGPWQDILATNIDGTHTVLEAARDAGVSNVLLASSIHAAGYLAASDVVDALPRPDTYYGVGKVAMEALGSLFADRFGMRIVSARICTFGVEPSPGRTVATWLSPADAARLISAAIDLEVPGHHVVWGVSNNAPGWFPLDPGRSIGFEPRDDAARWFRERDGVEPVHPDRRTSLLAGSFADLTLGQAPG